MGRNARLIAHHGYGHSSRDVSKCTDGIARGYILRGELPEESETQCWADGKPYLYDKAKGLGVESLRVWNPVADWREHLEEMKLWR